MIKKLIIGVLTIGVLYIVIASALIYTMAHKKPISNPDYIMVLGAKVKGEVPSLALKYRLQVAAKYAKKHPNIPIILTGGQGKDELITEAEAGRRFLVNEGIDESRLILEDQSTSTFENFEFAKKQADIKHKKGVIVSNNFHLYRSSIIAKRLGYDMHPLAAKTPDVVKVKVVVREYAAIIKTFLFDRAK